MVQRWAQELLGYSFSVVHRPARMMVDVDALNRCYGKNISTHMSIAAIFKARDVERRPNAYCHQAFQSKDTKITKIQGDDAHPESPWPILTDRAIANWNEKGSNTDTDEDSEPTQAKILLTSTPLRTTTHRLHRHQPYTREIRKIFGHSRHADSRLHSDRRRVRFFLQLGNGSSATATKMEHQTYLLERVHSQML